jgi:transcriptional regulator with XRE-family HTH domain
MSYTLCGNGVKNLVALKLRQLRESRGLSATYMAKRLGYKSASGYCNIEYGLNRLRFDQAIKIADILGVTVDELQG